MKAYNNINRPDFTPNFIKSLKPDEIFVFGSNLAGAHGGGAAHIALSRNEKITMQILEESIKARPVSTKTENNERNRIGFKK